MKPTYMYIGIATVVLIAWAYFVYTPYQTVTSECQVQQTELERKLTDFNQTVAQLPAFLKRKEQLESQKEHLTSKLYTKAEVLSLFESIRNQATRHNLSVREITPPVKELLQLNRQLPDSTTPQFLTIGIRLEGNYRNGSTFVRYLEEAPYFRGLKKCQFSGNRDENKPLSMFVSFKALLGNYRG